VEGREDEDGCEDGRRLWSVDVSPALCACVATESSRTSSISTSWELGADDGPGSDIYTPHYLVSCEYGLN
jgi:hypothetical protein